jgi:hypothetical protein
MSHYHVYFQNLGNGRNEKSGKWKESWFEEYTVKKKCEILSHVIWWLFFVDRSYVEVGHNGGD